MFSEGGVLGGGVLCVRGEDSGFFVGTTPVHAPDLLSASRWKYAEQIVLYRKSKL